MTKFYVTKPGVYTVGDGDTAKIKDPGGDIVLQAPSGNDSVGRIKIEFGKNDDVADKVTVDLATFNQDELHVDVKDYDPSDQIVLLGATITGVDPADSSKMNFTYVGEDGNTYTGMIHVKDRGEQDLTDANSPIVICFVTGTLITTLRGDIAVESLRVGDQVKTRDHGFQRIKWLGARRLDAIFLARNPDLWPIEISAGALGPKLPNANLLVSPQHRMCLEGAAAQLLFGCEEIFVAAKYLCNKKSIKTVKRIGSISYYHILFASHQVIFANGAASESLFPGDVALDAMGKESEAEILRLFPELAGPENPENRTARPVLKAYEARILQT